MASSPGPPFHEGCDANRNKSAGGAHDEDVPGAEAPHPNGLEDRAQTADDEGREDCPVQVGLALIGHPDHNGWSEHDSGQREHGRLKAETN